MSYIAPIHRPNSVRHALRIKLFPGEDDCLVLAKVNRLEIWKLDDSGTLALAASRLVNGTISMIQKLQPKDSDSELMFVGTERFQYFTLMWDASLQSLSLVDAFLDNDGPHMRDSQSFDKCIVDPTGRYMALLLWEGVLAGLRMKTIKSKNRELEWYEQIRISELFIKSATFLYSELGQPKIAILYQSRSDVSDSKLVTYRLTSDDKHTQISSFGPKDQIDLEDIDDPGAAILIPVKGDPEHKRIIMRNSEHAKAQLGGLIIVGDTRLVYYDDAARKRVDVGLREASIFVAWAEYDCSHYFVGDDYGVLWLLEIILDKAVVTSMEMSKIGNTSRASTLKYLGNDMLFVGSHYGDSQLYVFDKEHRSLSLVQTLENNAPILDLTIMDMGNREGEGQTVNEYSSGQARIVTGSGVWKDGSLRSVRSGVGLEDEGILPEMEGVRSVFSLKSPGASKDDTLIVSLLTETRVFTFSPEGEVEEVDAYKGLMLDGPTLLAKDLPGGRLLHIRPDKISLVDADGGVLLSSWEPQNGQITAVSANEEWILVSVNGSLLVSIQIQQDLVQVQHNDLGDRDQVACVHLPPQYPEIGVVGFWNSGSVSIVDVKTLESKHTESLRRQDDQASIPRDIALAQILPPHLSGPTLLVSMEDGFVITFNVTKADYALSNRKSVVLGTRHARLHLLPRENGIYNVFSTSEHPSLIYGQEGRIVYSAVTAQDATSICMFDSEAYPSSIVVATETELKVSKIDSQRRTHVQSLPMGETIRRIAHSRSERVFALGSIKRDIIEGEEIVTSSIKMVDEVVFQNLGNDFILDKSPTELVNSVIRAELTDSYGQSVERFIVGTSYEDVADGAAKSDDYKGRILVLGIDSDRVPYLVTSREVKGPCRCLGVMDGKIVAALAKTVIMYSYNEATTTSAELKKIASYRPATYPVDLAIEGSIIAVADLMKSITLVEYTPAAEGQRVALTEVARHHQGAWATAVCHIEDQTWLEADADGNLMVLRRNPAGVTLEDKKRLEITGEMNLGEQVNRMQKIVVEPSPHAIVVPRAFLGTVEGAVYVYGTIAPDRQDLLFRLQGSLAKHIKTTGNIELVQYRSFRNQERQGEGPFRFVDGELLERFLDADEETQEEICRGLGPDVESMRNLVEELKRLH